MLILLTIVSIEYLQKIMKRCKVDVIANINTLSASSGLESISKKGNKKAKKEILKVFGKSLYIHNKEVCSSSIH